MQQLSSKHGDGIRILFLGYGKEETQLIDAIIITGCEVWHTNEKITSTDKFDRVVSFGYRHILPKAVLESSAAPIINLHIAYLPYNRGYHPNFWAFYEGSAHGVTIHLIDSGIDTGPLLFQTQVQFSAEETTFEQTHKRLLAEIEALFIRNLEALLFQPLAPIPQQGKGTFHLKVDLPPDFAGWESNIAQEIARLKTHTAIHNSLTASAAQSE